MVDHLTPKERSRNMSMIRSTDTAPEVFVRSLLFRRGFRFRKNQANLPGKPDVVLKKYQTVIFIHGCFWHQHQSCKRANLPKSNRDYWVPKLARNQERDAEHKKILKSRGWRVYTLWECETKSEEEVCKKLRPLLNAK